MTDIYRNTPYRLKQFVINLGKSGSNVTSQFKKGVRRKRWELVMTPRPDDYPSSRMILLHQIVFMNAINKNSDFVRLFWLERNGRIARYYHIDVLTSDIEESIDNIITKLPTPLTQKQIGDGVYFHLPSIWLKID
ncbi:hypothetical protein BH431_004572 [Salmonella enterica subsp. enterica serovar Bovismorbificans]|nr:hypothetical protein [Salmonella enterica subsp. enterica serovar Bovismorbificans]